MSVFSPFATARMPSPFASYAYARNSPGGFGSLPTSFNSSPASSAMTTTPSAVQVSVSFPFPNMSPPPPPGQSFSSYIKEGLHDQHHPGRIHRKASYKPTPFSNLNGKRARNHLKQTGQLRLIRKMERRMEQIQRSEHITEQQAWNQIRTQYALDNGYHYDLMDICSPNDADLVMCDSPTTKTQKMYSQSQASQMQGIIDYDAEQLEALISLAPASQEASQIPESPALFDFEATAGKITTLDKLENSQRDIE